MGTRIARTRGPTPATATPHARVDVVFDFDIFLFSFFDWDFRVRFGARGGAARITMHPIRAAPRGPARGNSAVSVFFFPVVQANLMGVHFAFILQKNAP